MTQLRNQLTLEEFFALPEGDVIYELINAEAVPKFKNSEMSPKFFIVPSQVHYIYYCLHGRKEKGVL
jgi:hypothetical protein